MGTSLGVFIGGSKEQRRLVEWLTDFMVREYSTKLKPRPWYAPWPGGRFTLETLLSIVEDTDEAILFRTADDTTWYRETEIHAPRDNVTFEAGLFFAAHGRERTQLMVPEYETGDPRGTVKIPTDLSGLTLSYYAWRDDAPENTGLPNTARRVCDALAKLSPRPRVPSALGELTGREGVEEVRTFVGAWREVHINAIAKLAERSEARSIDVLAAYRVGEIARVLDSFRKRRDARLRACFADTWDAELVKAYQRKYHDRTADQIQNATKESIQRLLGRFTLDETLGTTMPRVRDVSDPPAASYNIRLTSQRITYGFYRIDDFAFIVPLDMKKNQNPAPLAWVISKETAPGAFAHYLQEYDSLFAEARNVFP